MRRNFDIQGGIRLVQSHHELDLHNDYSFVGLEYSVEARTLALQWRRFAVGGRAAALPARVRVVFQGVDEFRFLPRDAALPFTEDACLRGWGCWTDEDWADGVFHPAPEAAWECEWFTGIDFMSGATLVVRAESAGARIED